MKKVLGCFFLVVATCCQMFASVPFEGEIVVRVYKNYSENDLAINPLITNGADTLTMVVKGDIAKMTEARRSIVTVVTPKTYTNYSIVDNTGFTCPNPKEETNKMFKVTPTDQKREFLSYQATKYVSDVYATTGMEMQAWVCDEDFGLSEFLISILNYGFDINRMVLKCTTSGTGIHPYFICHEVISINPKSISDSEFDLPSNLKLEVVDDFGKYEYKNKQLKMAEKFATGLSPEALRFADLQTDFWSKHLPSKVPFAAKTYDLDEDWDF